jgi:hypothetical protein
MTREELDQLLELSQDIEADIRAINTALYSTEEDYDDMVLSAQMSLEKVANVFTDTVKYLDEQFLLKELEIKDQDELDQTQ